MSLDIVGKGLCAVSMKKYVSFLGTHQGSSRTNMDQEMFHNVPSHGDSCHSCVHRLLNGRLQRFLYESHSERKLPLALRVTFQIETCSVCSTSFFWFTACSALSEWKLRACSTSHSQCGYTARATRHHPNKSLQLLVTSHYPNGSLQRFLHELLCSEWKLLVLTCRDITLGMEAYSACCSNHYICVCAGPSQTNKKLLRHIETLLKW